MKKLRRFFSALMAVVLTVTTIMSAAPTVTIAAGATVKTVGGWNETLFMELSGVTDSGVTGVSYSGPSTGSLTGDDLTYLVRDVNGSVRIDIPGLKPGTYSMTVTTNSGTVTESNIVVPEQDRSGYAHFNYTQGVGAYKDDGTLKSNAIVLYVTDENKNTIELSYGGVTVTGIGNILNSVGQDVGGGTTSNGGTKPNSNQGILKLLAENNIPLVVRFVGCVSNTGLYKSGTFNAASTPKIDGLTIYDSKDHGGSVGDNGHMARMKSAKNVTLEGIGADAMIDGWGFHFMCESGSPDLGKNFEVRNLAFINTPEDAVGMEGVQSADSTSATITGSVERCWIHNCSFYVPSISSPAESDKSEGDGSVDFKRGQYFTASYNYYEGCHKTNLVGSSDTSLQYNLTYHHNVYKYVESRGPLSRNANIHMYNNAFIGQTSYAMQVRANAYIFSESNIFYMCKAPQDIRSGAIKSYNDSFASWINSRGTIVKNKTDKVSNSCKYAAAGIDYSSFDTDSSLSYIPTGDYKLEENHTLVMKDLYANAGPQKAEVIAADEVKMSDVSMLSLLPIKVTPTNVTSSLPYSAAPGKVSKTVWAFTVDTAFDIETTFTNGVLCNEAGVAILEASGKATSLPAGTYMIQSVGLNPGDATSLGEFKEVTISSVKITGADPNYDPNKLTGISLNKTSMNMVVDSASTLTVSYTPSTTTDDKTVTWSTSDAKVATVSNGVVAAVGKGTATITAKVGEFTATCKVTVTEPIALTGIALNKTSTEILSGSTETLTVTYTPSDTTEATDVTWTTGNSKIATVTDGVVKGIGEGTTTITAKVGNFTATCTVTVKIPEVAEGAYVHVFDTDGKTSDFYSITGSLSSSKGTITYNGQTLSQCLKMESSTSIKFTAPADGTLKLYFGGSTSASGKAVKVDGTSHDIGSDQTVTVNVATGSHTITKDDSINLWVMEYTPSSSGGSSSGHTHSYTSTVTTPATCETAGVRKYTCSCGDAYTEAIAATGHTYSSSYTVDVEATETTAGSKSRHCTAAGCDAKTDVTVIPATGSSSGDHTHSYTAKVTTEATCTTAGVKTYSCSCGSAYTETIAATGHSYSSSYTVDVQPTETTTGSKSRHCLFCGDKTDITIIPATGSSTTTATAVTINNVGGWWESAYVEWAPVSGASGYNVYIRKTSETTYTQLDTELIRKYPDYWRADALGLTAGSYIMKVVPIKSGSALSGTMTKIITVKAHDRSGYAWEGSGTASGAYKEDGTLKSGARVVYITESNKADMMTELDAFADGNYPLALRLIGNITDASNFDKGDLLIDNGGNTAGLTIEGVGVDATCNGWGIRLKNSSNVEIRNLGVMNCNSSEGDNIGLQQKNDHIWVHNCDLFYGDAGSDADQAKGDGALDTKKSTYVTHSYNHFWDSGKCNLQGANSSDTSNYITYHHNWYDHSDSRHPRVRVATVHVYNNYYDGNSKYGIGSTTDSDIFAEANYFRNCKYPMMISKQGTDALGEGTFSGEVGGIIKAFNNYIIGAESFISYADNKTQFDAYVATSRNETVPSSVKAASGGATYNNFDTASNFYEYTVDSPEDARINVVNYSGRMGGGDFDWEFDDSTDDTSYDVDTKLKAALVAYETTLVSVGGNSVTLPTDNTGDVSSTEPTEGENKDASLELGDVTEDLSVIKSISLDKTSVALAKTKTTTLTVSYKPTNTTADKTVTWSSNNPSVATVANGVVTAVAAGTAVITAKVGDLTATCTVTVSEPVALTGISLDKTSGDLEVNGTETLTVIYNPTNTTDDKTVTWTSNNTSVATVTNGVVTAIGTGTATITATVGSYKATYTVTVTAPEVSVGEYTHIFQDSGLTSSFYTINGNTSTTKGSVTYAGRTLTTCLKMESSTSIKFNAPAAGTLTLVFGGSTSASGKAVQVDGKSYDIDSTQIVTVDLAAGNHTITKDDSIFLWVMDYAVAETHVCVYSSSVTTEATCTTSGVKTFTCSCGKSYTETIAAYGHTYGDFVVDKAATYTEAGEKSKYCGRCGARTEVTVIPKLTCTTHNYKYSSTVTPATCTSTGEDLYACANCGAEETIVTAMLSHNYGEFVIDKAATYTEEGEKSRYCDDCGARTEITVIAKLVCSSHNYEYTSTLIKASCTTAGAELHTCTICDATKEVAIAKTDHTYGDFVVDKAPTYTEAGEKSKYCTVCGNRTAITAIPVLEACTHDYKFTKTVTEATCTTEGEDLYTCDICGETTTVATAKAAHTYGDFVTDKEATYKEAGEKSKYCSVCNARTEVTEIPKLVCDSHTLVKVGTATEATCTTEGVDWYACTKCGAASQMTVAKKAHTYGDFVIDKAATYTEAGEKSKYCSVCGDRTEITEIPQLVDTDHDYVYSETKTEATCTSTGIDIYVCSKNGCGATTEVVTGMTAHTYGDFVVDKEATYTTTGEKSKYCSVCNARTEVTVIPMKVCTAHDYQYTETITEATCTLNGTALHTCTICGGTTEVTTDKKAHTYGEFVVDKAPTYTEVGEKSKYCSVCGHRTAITEIPVLEPCTHSYVYYSHKTEATCTSEGVDIHKCSKCGATTEVTVAKTAHNYGGWVVDVVPSYTTTGEMSKHCSDCDARIEITTLGKTPCPGHDYVLTSTVRTATCTSEGLEIHTCTVCQATKEVVLEKTDHTYGDFVIDKQATYTEAGEKSKHCTVCDHRTEITVVPMLESVAIKYGDIDYTNEITVQDAVALKKYLAGDKSVEINLAAADLNADGAINTLDAVKLMKYLAGVTGIELGKAD